MSQMFNTGIVVSRSNTTTIPLAANAIFTGATDDVTSYEEIDINVAGAPANAPGSLYFEFSPDGINWDVSTQISGNELPGPSIVPQLLRVILPYFRVVYINGNVDQTAFRLTVTYHRASGTRLTRYLNQVVDFTEPVENAQAFMAAKNTDGSFSHVSLNGFGALQVNDNIGDGYLCTIVNNQTNGTQITRIDGYVETNPIVQQGNQGSLEQSWFFQVSDGYNGPAAVKPPNFPAMPSDPALVVALSPNNSFTTNFPKPSTVTISNVAASNMSVVLLPANPNRLGASIYNDSISGFMYMSMGGVSGDLSNFVIKLLPLGYYELPFGYTGEIDASWSVIGGCARIAEYTP